METPLELALLQLADSARAIRVRGQKATSGGVLGTAQAFFRAADALDAVERATKTAQTPEAGPGRGLAETVDAVKWLDNLERGLPEYPGRFSVARHALSVIASALSGPTSPSPGSVASDAPTTRSHRRYFSSITPPAPYASDLRVAQDCGAGEDGRHPDADGGREGLLDRLEAAAGAPEYRVVLHMALDDADFDPTAIQDRLSEARRAKLDAGARPTARELKLWREYMEQNRELGDGITTGVEVWRSRDAAGPEWWWAGLLEDQGTVSERMGPYPSMDALEAKLRELGTIAEP